MIGLRNDVDGMTDIVERLRNPAHSLAQEAANEIVRLRTEYAELSERWKLLQEEIGRLRSLAEFNRRKQKKRK
jgi:hypothetical protein